MLGYVLVGEEHAPATLVENAVRAEQAGFAFAFVSDHFHPWNDRQGHSPFVWTLLGALARETSRLELGTAVTCTILRTHPAIVAHAAATTACLADGRFFLGVGTGEYLNEHVTGRPWPRFKERLEMLEEAIVILRLLFRGGYQSYRGRHFLLDDARLYDLPKCSPPIYMAASGPRAARTAARIADGLIALGPDVLEHFEAPKPRYAQLSVCWAPTREEAVRTAHRQWPEMALAGNLFAELKTPRDFQAACRDITPDDVAAAVVCGPDPDEHVQALVNLRRAGFDRIAVHQIGPDQAGFLDFYRSRVFNKI